MIATTPPSNLTPYTRGILRRLESARWLVTWHTPHRNTVTAYVQASTGAAATTGTITIGRKTGKVLRAGFQHGYQGARETHHGVNAVRDAVERITQATDTLGRYCPADPVQEISTLARRLWHKPTHLRFRITADGPEVYPTQYLGLAGYRSAPLNLYAPIDGCRSRLAALLRHLLDACPGHDALTSQCGIWFSLTLTTSPTAQEAARDHHDTATDRQCEPT